MVRYVFKRILQMIPVIIGVLLFVFVVSRASGDPVYAILGPDAAPEQYEIKRKELGLNQPLIRQFLDYVIDVVVSFDLGNDYSNNQPVAAQLLARLPVSLLLSLIGLVISCIIGIPLGVISAVKHNTVIDRVVTVLALVAASLPSFWLGFMLIILFSLKLGWFPASGMASAAAWILPSIAIGLGPVASLCRTTRSNMLESIRQDFITTARSKGISETKVIYKHALKNSIIPVLTIIGVIIAMNIGNAVVVEAVFAIPGLGSLMMNAIYANDYPIIQGCVLVFSLIVCVMNLLVDIAYGFVDPRIKAQYISSAGHKTKKQKASVANA